MSSPPRLSSSTSLTLLLSSLPSLTPPSSSPPSPPQGRGHGAASLCPVPLHVAVHDGDVIVKDDCDYNDNDNNCGEDGNDNNCGGSNGGSSNPDGSGGGGRPRLVTPNAVALDRTIFGRPCSSDNDDDDNNNNNDDNDNNNNDDDNDGSARWWNRVRGWRSRWWRTSIAYRALSLAECNGGPLIAVTSAHGLVSLLW